MRGVIDARAYQAAEQALATLRGHPQGARIGHILNVQLDDILAHLVPYYHGLQRVGPGVVLAGLPAAAQSGSQPRLGPTVGAGGAGLGYLP